MRASVLTIILASTFGTIALVGGTALGGPTAAAAAPSRRAAVRLPAPEHLSAATRGEVHSRMNRHGNTMWNLVKALILLDRPTIANLAGRIADEEVVAHADGGGPDKLRLLLPKEFFAQESALQSNARDLAAAAVNKEPGPEGGDLVMLKVRDLMSPVVLSVAADDSAASAAEILARAGISGAAVRNEFGDVMGIVSQADLTNERLTGGRRHPTVSDVMTPGVLAVMPTIRPWWRRGRWPRTTSTACWYGTPMETSPAS